MNKGSGKSILVFVSTLVVVLFALFVGEVMTGETQSIEFMKGGALGGIVWM